MFTVAILAGGLAKRLHPITEATPKSLIEILGKPFIDHQLSYLRTQGITSVVICIGHLGEMIQDVVGDGSKWGIKVSYSLDGSKLLGTGGAIQKALPLLGQNFFIMYGDSYLPINFYEVQVEYSDSEKLGLMTIYKNRNEWDKSNVIYSDKKLLEYNKFLKKPSMHYIDYGLTILNAEAMENYPKGTNFDLAIVYNELSMRNELVGKEVFNRFYEIGSHSGLLDTSLFLERNK